MRIIAILLSFFLLTGFVGGIVSPISNAISKFFSKSISKTSDNLIDIPSKQISRTLKDSTSNIEDLSNINKLIKNNFHDDPNINLLSNLDKNFNQIPQNLKDAVNNLWDQAYKNDGLFYDNLLKEIQYEIKFSSSEDFIRYLAMAETVLFSSLVGFSFTYSDELQSSEGGMITRPIEPNSKEPISVNNLMIIKCHQYFNVVSLRDSSSYSATINLLNSVIKQINEKTKTDPNEIIDLPLCKEKRQTYDEIKMILLNYVK